MIKSSEFFSLLFARAALSLSAQFDTLNAVQSISKTVTKCALSSRLQQTDFNVEAASQVGRCLFNFAFAD